MGFFFLNVAYSSLYEESIEEEFPRKIENMCGIVIRINAVNLVRVSLGHLVSRPPYRQCFIFQYYCVILFFVHLVPSFYCRDTLQVFPLVTKFL